MDLETKQNNIVEYYALDESDGYLIFDKKGLSTLLSVKSEERPLKSGVQLANAARLTPVLA